MTKVRVPQRFRCRTHLAARCVVIACLLLGSGAHAQQQSALARVKGLGLEKMTVGRVIAYYAPADRARAEQLASLAERAAALMQREIRLSFEFGLAALPPEQWFSEIPAGPWTIPWASESERLIIVPARGERLPMSFRRAVDFIALHEYGHLAAKQYFHPESRRLPGAVHWFEELLATYIGYAFVRSSDPEWAQALRQEWTVNVDSYTPPELSLDWRFMTRLPPEELGRVYGWYQNLLNLRVADVYDQHGIAFLRALKQSLPWQDLDNWTTASLLPLLDKIAPGFEAWAKRLQSPTAPIAAAAPTLAIRGVTIIDVTDGLLRADRTVIVQGDRIRHAGRTGEVEVPAGATVVDAAGKFLIPGLWDMHVHTRSEAEARAVHYPLAIANGVTGVRVMWGRPFNLTQRKEIASGKLLGPRMIVSAPIVDGRMWKGSLDVVSPEEARRAVASFPAEGYDFVKVYQFLSRDVYLAMAAEAKRVSIPFTGHVPLAISAREASDAGHRSLEHGIGLALACSRDEARIRPALTAAAATLPPFSFAEHGRLMVRAELEPLPTHDAERCAALAATLRKNGTWIVPTLVLYRGGGAAAGSPVREDARLKYLPSDMREAFAKAPPIAGFEPLRTEMGRLTTLMLRTGVGVLAGTDTPNPYVLPGFSLHDELALLVEAGFTPLEALQTATINPARFLNMTGSIGTVESGKLADLVLLDASPLADIRNTTTIRAVVANGRYLDRAALDAILRAAETPYVYLAPPAIGDGWRTAPAADGGLDPRTLESMPDAIRRQEYANVHAVLLEQ